jgi:hypothetical protein
MTQEEIRKLLGGYAANTLTEGERTALFEAALEDQDLFNALQNEDALRELLADPVSREQIRQALEPAAADRRRAFWMQPWLIGSAVAAVIATVIVAIGIVTWHRGPVRQAAVPFDQLSQSRVEPKMEAEAPRPVQPTPGVAANAPLYKSPLVRYSVLRSGPSGDAVRIEVVSKLAGNLALYRTAAGGKWERVFPSNDSPGLPIAANVSYQIPDDPIAIRGDQEKLRLVIEPAARSGIVARLATGAASEPRAQALERKTEGPTPLVIEIAIGQN